ncbi:hypothetical protein D3C73_496510 [compost metagenome]
MRDRRHIDRSGHVEGHHVGERQIDHGGVEQAGIGSCHDHTGKLQARFFDLEKRGCRTAGQKRPENKKGTERAQQQDLPNGKTGDQPFAHGIVQGEHQVAQKHQKNAGQNGVAADGISRCCFHDLSALRDAIFDGGRDYAGEKTPSHTGIVSIPVGMGAPYSSGHPDCKGY